MIETAEVLEVCAYEFPDVEKRTYKEPDFLKKDGHKWEVERRHDAMIEHKENAEKVMQVSTTDVFYKAYKKKKDPWKYAYSYKNTSGSKKYKCIDGPLDGKFSTIRDERWKESQEYVSYNCAENNRHVSDKDKEYPTGMLIHKSLLK